MGSDRSDGLKLELFSGSDDYKLGLPPESCPFCDISAHRAHTPFERLFDGSRKSSEQVFATLSTVFACVDSAPITHGHCMVITNRHVSSYAQASSIEVDEATLLCQIIERRLSRAGAVCFFEHGPSKDLATTAGCGINHAHLHALPIDAHHFEKLLECYEFKPISGLHALGDAVHECAYLYVQTPVVGSMVATISVDESQAVRRAISESIQDEHIANWKDQLYFAKQFGTRAAVETSLRMLEDIEESCGAEMARED